MNQTKLLLENAREDCSEALDVLMMVSKGMLSATINDTMYAYMIACDWCEWTKNPNSGAGNPLFGIKSDFKWLLMMFQSYADDLGANLVLNKDLIKEVFVTLNPHLIEFWRSPNPTLKSETKMFLRSLRFTAKFFEDKFGDNDFNEILDRNQVPPMSELSKLSNPLI